jgi:rSAM-associated Gly-rich repeat protein
MTKSRHAARELLKLLPSGVAGLSMSLAAADASAIAVAGQAEKADRSVGDRMEAIRRSVAGALEQQAKPTEPFVAINRDLLLAWWGNGWHNGGWHNGGWGNGGAAWHNGGWGNGGAAWHNGGWANGGAAWHNGGFRNW